MKKAFTMIEVIFVVVVLGIIVAAVIPKIHPNNLNKKFKVEKAKALKKHQNKSTIQTESQSTTKENW